MRKYIIIPLALYVISYAIVITIIVSCKPTNLPKPSAYVVRG
jgi:hypothetical protein